jgi:hypothetical protein
MKKAIEKIIEEIGITAFIYKSDVGDNTIYDIAINKTNLASKIAERMLSDKEIEKVLIKTNANIPEIAERYGDYFYRLAKAIIKARKKKMNKTCNCDKDCNTDPRTLFVCPCPCHYE